MRCLTLPSSTNGPRKTSAHAELIGRRSIGNALYSSQWAFLSCQEAIQVFDISICRSPGHTGIERNEAADRLADLGTAASCDLGMTSEPTVSGIRSLFYDLQKEAQLSWWAQSSIKLSNGYKKWNLEYRVTPLPELDLFRATLHWFLSIRLSHRDFSWYHTKYAHEDTKLLCSCGHKKTPEHIVHCRKTTTASQFCKYHPQPRLLAWTTSHVSWQSPQTLQHSYKSQSSTLKFAPDRQLHNARHMWKLQLLQAPPTL